MSILRPYDGPSLAAHVAYLAGIKAAEAVPPSPAYNLAGQLYLSESGWVLLAVPNALVRGVFAAMNEPGAELPPSGPSGKLEAHVTVFRPEELEQVGGPDVITE